MEEDCKTAHEEGHKEGVRDATIVYLEKSIDTLNLKLDKDIIKKLEQISADVLTLKVKASMWGAIGGVIMWMVGAALSYLAKVNHG